MTRVRLVAVVVVLAVVAALSTLAQSARGQASTITIGVLFDHTGPFAAAGAMNNWRGVKMAIDSFNERGGVLGRYKIVQIDADTQSKTEVAINEAERLLNAEKVDVLSGVFGSAQAVPLAEKVDKQKRFFWITTAVSDAVFRHRNLQYVFRPQISNDMIGTLSVQYVATFAPDKLHAQPKDLRVAIVHEDGPYGTGVAANNEAEAKRQGMQIVLKEGYSVNAPDLSALVTKLRAARPDVLFHAGYNPDIALFTRQMKEQGFRVKVMMGQGAGHTQLDKMKEALGKDVEGFHTVDSIASQQIDPKKLKPAVAEMTHEMVRRYRTEFGEGPISAHVSIGFNNMWIFLNDVLPRAIQKSGGWTPDALAAAARETDIPDGGTMQGYGVKFHPPGHEMAGQNQRAYPAVSQVIDGKFEIVFPRSIATAPAALVLSASSPFAAR